MPKPDPNIPRAAEAAESEGRQFARLITPLRIPQPRGALGVGAALTALATAMIGLSTGTAHAAPQRPASASAVPASALPTTSQLRREVDRVVAAGVPGVVVLIRDGRRIVRVAGGSARLKPQRSMRVDDRFRIASLTKTYVATVVLQLAGEGKLSLAWAPRPSCPTSCATRTRSATPA